MAISKAIKTMMSSTVQSLYNATGVGRFPAADAWHAVMEVKASVSEIKLLVVCCADRFPERGSVPRRGLGGVRGAVYLHGYDAIRSAAQPGARVFPHAPSLRPNRRGFGKGH